MRRFGDGRVIFGRERAGDDADEAVVAERGLRRVDFGVGRHEVFRRAKHHRFGGRLLASVRVLRVNGKRAQGEDEDKNQINGLFHGYRS